MRHILDNSILPRTLSVTLMLCLFPSSPFFLILNCSSWLLEKLGLYPSHCLSLTSSRESRSLDIYLGYPKQVSQKNPSFTTPEETFFAALEETSFAAPEETFFTMPKRILLRLPRRNSPYHFFTLLFSSLLLRTSSLNA